MKAKKGYNLLGRDYDVITKRDFNIQHLELPSIKKFVKSVKGKNVLDIGCAAGNHTGVLIKKGAIVTGIDVSEEMLKIIRKRFPNHNFLNVDMNKLPFKDNLFDIIFFGLCLHYEKNLKKIFKETYRVLKKKGRIIISTHNPYLTGTEKIIIKNKKYLICSNYFQDKKKKLKLKEIELDIYPKTISGLFNPLIKNGFRLTNIKEPRPKISSKHYNLLKFYKRRKIPLFILIEAEKI